MISETQPSWTPEKIQRLIDDKIEEGAQFDYKAAGAFERTDSKKAEITKDVSAFANSAGGTIIYGLKEFSDDIRKHLPEKIDPIDGRDFSREWLDQIIGQINPRIENVLITPVRVGAETWQTCYVVEIPTSYTAHQARDFKYYRRYNFESVPMADYEIRDVMNRRKHTKLKFEVQIRNTNRMTTKIFARIWNTGTVIAQHYSVSVWMPTIINGGKLFKDDLIIQENEGLKFWRLSLHSSNNHPLFPKSDVICEEEIPFAVTPYQSVPEPTTDYLICKLFADEMPCVEKKISVAAALNNWT
jgi:hypothetical protein